MTKSKNNIEKSDGRLFRVFEIFTEVIGWIQIVASPLLIGFIIGAIIYFTNPTKIRLISGIAVATIGLTIGIIWATREWKKNGTIRFMSRIMDSPELDDYNMNLGRWLTRLNGKTVDKIYQVDFNEDRYDDYYLPWKYFIVFKDYDKFLEIEGDFDGNHIKKILNANSNLNKKFNENKHTDEQDLWRVCETNNDETLGRLLGKKIEFIEYGIDKDIYEINGTKFKGQKDVFNFIRFNCDSLNLTIFEGSVTGLEVSEDKNVKLNFEETFEIYKTV